MASVWGLGVGKGSFEISRTQTSLTIFRVSIDSLFIQPEHRLRSSSRRLKRMVGSRIFSRGGWTNICWVPSGASGNAHCKSKAKSESFRQIFRWRATGTGLPNTITSYRHNHDNYRWRGSDVSIGNDWFAYLRVAINNNRQLLNYVAELWACAVSVRCGADSGNI